MLFVVSSDVDQAILLGDTDMTWYLRITSSALLSCPCRRRKRTHLRKTHAHALSTREDPAAATLQASPNGPTAIVVLAIEDRASKSPWRTMVGERCCGKQETWKWMRDGRHDNDMLRANHIPSITHAFTTSIDHSPHIDSR